ncbi:MAG: hypothetical protein E7Y34_00605 [Mycoplasma sp.]|nr:hypothetical protein [Mycoplasma sp.]
MEVQKIVFDKIKNKKNKNITLVSRIRDLLGYDILELVEKINEITSYFEILPVTEKDFDSIITIRDLIKWVEQKYKEKEEE